MSLSAAYAYPESAVIQQLERERLPIISQDFPLAQVLPIENLDSDNIMWEIKDDIQGFTFHSPAGQPFPQVQESGVTRFYTGPGHFGESMTIPQEKIERMRNPGTLGTPLDVSAEIGDLQQILAIREQTLIEKLRADLLTTGQCSALNPDGSTVPICTFNVQQYSPAIGFNNPSTAVPFQEFANIRSQFAGHGASFGAGAVALGNARTVDSILNNTNQADLGGKKIDGGSTVNSIPDLNRVLLRQGYLQLQYADGTYLNGSGAVTRFIPDGYLIVVGYRSDTGLKAGGYCMTRNVNNGNQPGIYAATGIAERAPKLPWTERGHNGGLRINYLHQILLVNAWA